MVYMEFTLVMSCALRKLQKDRGYSNPKMAEVLKVNLKTLSRLRRTTINSIKKESLKQLELMIQEDGW